MYTREVCAMLDRNDLEELIRAYTNKLNDATCRLRLEELAKEGFHDEVRPIAKKLAMFVELWENATEKEAHAKSLEELTRP